tara:strand:- start:1778 stop:3745 length:1968 start_codon:yes stop_codon:yes gene_type:complete
MKSLLTIIFAISFSLFSKAQCDFPAPFNGNTGANMTVMLTPLFVSSLNITEENAYIVAISANGLVIGSTNLVGLSQTSIAVWGDDSSTNNVDGALGGEVITFQLVNGSDIYDVEMPNTTSYTTNSMLAQITAAVVTPNCISGCTSEWAENFNELATTDNGTCYLNGCTDIDDCNYTENATIDNGSCTGKPGCTDNSFTEFYHQGYTPGCDDGSCSTTISDLGINSSYFVSPTNTGANMTLGFNLSNNLGLEGSTVAAFFDLNNDGTTSECVGLTLIQNGFFTMALWGNDSSTDEIDGLQAGDNDLIFAVINSEGDVMAFNANPLFSGYATNGSFVITEIDLNVTIYGCMDVNYCNYNEAAEEDDGSCLGTPGCTNDHFVEFDTNASCNLEGSCSITWQSAYLEEVEYSTNLQSDLVTTMETADLAALEAQAELDLTIAQATQASLEANDVLSATIATADLAAQEAQIELDLTIAQATQASIDASSLLSVTIADFNASEDQYLAQIAELESPIVIDIINGWNNIGYTRKVSQDVIATLEAISTHILIVKNNDAEVYWPEFGFNGIGDFIPGQGYQVKTNQMIADYFFPDTQGLRIEVSTSIPQWVIDLPADIHPNDIRTLVKVVNMLGQEVNPDYSLKGTTLIYLYNDASVEKRIK